MPMANSYNLRYIGLVNQLLSMLAEAGDYHAGSVPASWSIHFSTISERLVENVPSPFAVFKPICHPHLASSFIIFFSAAQTDLWTH